MNVQSINSTNYYNRPTSFKSHSRKIFNEEGELLYRTTTWPYRNDLDWDKFVRLLDKKYADVDRVNIVDYACSIGTEPFCLVAKLIKILKSKADKFLPVLAKDIDKENIEIAKSNRLIDNIYGLVDLKYGLGKEDYNDYFDTCRLEPIPPSNYSETVEIVPKPFLQDKVIFEQADILTDIDKIPKTNTVVMCRNFWPYLKPLQREELVKILASNFDNTCLFVVGDFDHEKPIFQGIKDIYDKDYPDVFDVEESFRKYGLRKTKLKNVWYKP